MFEIHRKYSHCIFCGGMPVTREHLFGRGLAARLREQLPWIMYQASGQDPETASDGKAVMNWTAKLLCEECNGPKLGPSMLLAYPVLMRLITNEATEITTQERAYLLRYFERLAILVDIATSNEQLDPAYEKSQHFQANAKFRTCPPLHNPVQRKYWLQGHPTGIRIRVWIGRHLGELGLDPAINTFPEKLLRNGGPFVTVAKRFHMVIGHLAFCIDIGVPQTFCAPQNCFVPMDFANVPLKWPASRDVDYLDFVDLMAEGEDKLNAFMIFLDPLTRRYWEREQLIKVGLEEIPPGYVGLQA